MKIDTVIKNFSSDKLVLKKLDFRKPSKKVSVQKIKEDVGLFSKMLIQGHCGWNYFSWIMKWKIRRDLFRFYTIDKDISLFEFYANIWKVFSNIKDKHLNVFFLNPEMNVFQNPYAKFIFPSMGANLCLTECDSQTTWKVKTEKIGRKKIAVIAVKNLPPPTDPIWEGFIEGKGYEPKIKLKPGTDAYFSVLEKLKQDLLLAKDK